MAVAHWLKAPHWSSDIVLDTPHRRLDVLAERGVNVTLLCEPSASQQPWLTDLPDAFEEVRLEVHDPKDRKKLAYLATTRKGRRLYLNRTAVDADQLVVLGRRTYDPLLGYSGAAGALYPALCASAGSSRGTC